MRRGALLLGLLYLGCSAAAQVPATPVGQDGTLLLSDSPFGRGPLRVRLYLLRNGLRALLLPDPSLGVVAHRTCLGMGDLEDPPGKHGLAHLVEHLVYRQDRSEDLDERLEPLAGRAGAYTGVDHTCYVSGVPPTELEFLLRHDAWRLSRLRVTPATLGDELAAVIRQERDYREELEILLYTRLWSLAHTADPFHILSAQWQRQVERLTLDDLQRFFTDFYVPANMLLVLVGDFREDEALRLLERHHGALPQRPVARTAPWREPRQSEERRLTFSSEHVEQAELLVAYQAVPQRHRDLPTLGVLGPILAGRLRERLIDRERMAQEVRWELKPDRHAGLLLARITLGEDTAPQEAEPPFSEVVAALAQAPPGADELARARTAAETAFWHALTTADGRAGALARYELLAGDHRRLFQHADAIARVTARQVRRAAERYLQPAGRSIILVEPPGGAPNTDTAAAP